MSSVRGLAVAAAFVLAGTLPGSQHRVPPARPTVTAPAHVGGWSLAGEAPAAVVSPGVTMHQDLYRNPEGEEVLVTVLSASAPGWASEIHAPEACHMARGDEVRRLEATQLPDGTRASAFSWTRGDGASGTTLHWLEVDGRPVSESFAPRLLEAVRGGGALRAWSLVRFDAPVRAAVDDFAASWRMPS